MRADSSPGGPGDPEREHDHVVGRVGGEPLDHGVDEPLAGHVAVAVEQGREPGEPLVDLVAALLDEPARVEEQQRTGHQPDVVVVPRVRGQRADAEQRVRTVLLLGS